jgi:hypothetical protein
MNEELVKPQQTAIENTVVRRREEFSPAVSQLRYYIHDHSHAFRLQLVGSFTQKDIPELDGCWTTARRSVVKRKICIDLLGLLSLDAAAREWLSKMSGIPGIEFLASAELAPELPEGSSVKIQAVAKPCGRRWPTVLRFINRERRSSVMYRLPAAESPSQSS